MAAALAAALARPKTLVEPQWVGMLARSLPAATPCFIASSMPVRDAEYFCRRATAGGNSVSTAGANGIDGTLSTALGTAHGGAPAVLVTGDLALLHDTNGFLLKPKFKGSPDHRAHQQRRVRHLPASARAQFNPPFEEFFATPQEADFKKLCSAYGVAHVRVRDAKHLATLVAKLPARGIRVLELRTDRKRDAAFRQTLFARVAG